MRSPIFSSELGATTGTAPAADPVEDPIEDPVEDPIEDPVAALGASGEGDSGLLVAAVFKGVEVGVGSGLAVPIVSVMVEEGRWERGDGRWEMGDGF
jgi:hypothetical protein